MGAARPARGACTARAVWPRGPLDAGGHCGCPSRAARHAGADDARGIDFRGGGRAFRFIDDRRMASTVGDDALGVDRSGVRRGRVAHRPPPDRKSSPGRACAQSRGRRLSGARRRRAHQERQHCLLRVDRAYARLLARPQCLRFERGRSMRDQRRPSDRGAAQWRQAFRYQPSHGLGRCAGAGHAGLGRRGTAFRDDRARSQRGTGGAAHDPRAQRAAGARARRDGRGHLWRRCIGGLHFHQRTRVVPARLRGRGSIARAQHASSDPLQRGSQ